MVGRRIHLRHTINTLFMKKIIFHWYLLLNRSFMHVMLQLNCAYILFYWWNDLMIIWLRNSPWPVSNFTKIYQCYLHTEYDPNILFFEKRGIGYKSSISRSYYHRKLQGIKKEGSRINSIFGLLRISLCYQT